MAKEQTTTTIEVPLAEVDARAYLTPKIELRLLDIEQRIAYRSLFNALHANHAKLANGRHVDKPTDAIRWLLEQIHAGIVPQENGLPAEEKKGSP